MTILVTGAAGFIGCEVALRLLARGDNVIGLDNMNDYYNVRLKQARLKRIEECGMKWHFVQGDLIDVDTIQNVFKAYRPIKVVHLAAQAGVRYSIENPSSYIKSNLDGFGHILECCRIHSVNHLVYASSSSVYGGNQKLPFSEQDAVNHPVSLYAATKKANELMAHTYSDLYNLPATGLRFFTVYGPWGRPDMAPMLFAKAILSNQPIKIFNGGDMKRDFTYIDDIVEGVIRCLDKPATIDSDFDPLHPNPATARCPHRIFNIGNSSPTELLSFILILEEALGKKAIKDFQEMQPGDVVATSADTSALRQWIGFQPNTPLVVGLRNFANWVKQYPELIDLK